MSTLPLSWLSDDPSTPIDESQHPFLIEGSDFTPFPPPPPGVALVRPWALNQTLVGFIPGPPASEFDLLFLFTLLAAMWLYFSCRMHSCASVAAGLTMLAVQTALIVGAWVTGPYAGEGIEWPKGPVFCVFVNGPSCWGMDAIQWVLFFVLLACNAAGTLAAVPAAGALVNRVFDPALASWSYDEVLGEQIKAPSLTVLVPCYMPNEQQLIRQTIDHILQHLRYPHGFTLIVCYNTPKPLPIEAELAELDGTTYTNEHGEGEHTLTIMRVNDSTSKAHNLNAAMGVVNTENVVIYDADHHPDPGSLMILTSFMQGHRCSCVQGSTYLRVTNSLLALIINAEFFVTHFVIFPAQQAASGTGFFGGSNALWQSDVLRRQVFRHDVQTEDIELSARTLLSGNAKIRFCPEARSGELPPASLSALFKQRMRWAIGWDQVTKLHFRRIAKARLHPCKKLSLYYILPARWLLLVLSLITVFAVPAMAVIEIPMAGAYKIYTDPWSVPDVLHPLLWGNTRLLAQYQWMCFLTLFAVVFINACLYEWRYPWRIIVICFFVMFGQIYLLINLTLMIMSLIRICRGTDSGWVVTARAAESKKKGILGINKSDSFSDSLSHLGFKVASRIDLEGLARQMRESTIGIFGADFATAGAASERKAPELAENPSTVSITGNTPQRRSRLAADIDEDATDLLTAPATNRSLSAIRACSYSSSPQSPYSAPIGRQQTSYSRLGAGHSEDGSGHGVVLFSDGAQRRRASMPADSSWREWVSGHYSGWFNGNPSRRYSKGRAGGAGDPDSSEGRSTTLMALL